MSADPTKVVSEDGTPIAVWRSGAGPPLVLIHGAAADHNRWAPVLPALEERFAVFAVDRRGRGRSGDAADYALEREYEDVVAVVESAGAEVSVLGHSYGGICALEAALLTDAIRALVLYEPPMGYLKSPPHVVDRLHTLLEEGATSCWVTSCGRSPGFHQIRSSCCVPCRPGKRGSPQLTRFPGRSERAGNTCLIQLASATSTSQRYISKAVTAANLSRRPVRRYGGLCRTAASRSCRGSDTLQWTPPPICSQPMC